MKSAVWQAIGSWCCQQETQWVFKLHGVPLPSTELALKSKTSKLQLKSKSLKNTSLLPDYQASSLIMKITYLSSILALLAMLAVPGSYSLPTAEQDLEAALEEATELDLMDGGRARRAIFPSMTLN